MRTHVRREIFLFEFVPIPELSNGQNLHEYDCYGT